MIYTLTVHDEQIFNFLTLNYVYIIQHFDPKIEIKTLKVRFQIIILGKQVNQITLS